MERLDERVAVLMIDLDHFKQINDTYGHGVGDGVLAETARIFAAGLRTIDRAYRYGGEEFAIILAGADEIAAQAIAERLRASIAGTPLRIDGNSIPVTMSIGVATTSSPYPGRVATLMKAADAALYRAKSDGRNRVVVHQDDDLDVIHARALQRKTAG